jgi:hypothetical protein
MKRSLLTLATMTVLALLMVACGGSRKVDTSKLSKSFASAPPAVKAEIDKFAAAVKTKDYAGCITALKNAVGQGELSEEQKQAVYDAVVDIQVIIAEKPTGDMEALYTSIEELTAKLEGRPATRVDPRMMRTPEAKP